MVQFWTTDVRPVQQALHAAGIDAAITRADFEAALRTEIDHRRFDVAILDPTTPGISREIVQQCLHESGREIPLVVLEDVRSLGDAVRRLLNVRRN